MDPPAPVSTPGGLARSFSGHSYFAQANFFPLTFAKQRALLLQQEALLEAKAKLLRQQEEQLRQQQQQYFQQQQQSKQPQQLLQQQKNHSNPALSSDSGSTSTMGTSTFPLVQMKNTLVSTSSQNWQPQHLERANSQELYHTARQSSHNQASLTGDCNNLQNLASVASSVSSTPLQGVQQKPVAQPCSVVAKAKPVNKAAYSDLHKNAVPKKGKRLEKYHTDKVNVVQTTLRRSAAQIISNAKNILLQDLIAFPKVEHVPEDTEKKNPIVDIGENGE
jgi:hypothetical protein